MQDFILQTLENSTNIGWYFMLVGGGGLVIYFLYNYLHGEDPLRGDITNLEQTGKRLEFFKVCFIAFATPALLSLVVAGIVFALVATLIGIPPISFKGETADEDEDEEDLWGI